FAALAAGFGWRMALVVAAGVIALLAAPLLNIGAGMLAASSDDPPPMQSRGENRAALHRAFRRREFWLIALAMALMGFNHAILIAHILPILADRGASPAAAVAAASLIGPSQVAGRLLLMRFEAYIAPASAAFWTIATAVGASALLLAAGASPLLVFAFALAQGGAIGVVSILRPVLMLEHLGRTAFGAISGRAAVIYLVSAAAAPFLGALIWKAGGYSAVIATALACALAALALAIFLRQYAISPPDHASGLR
ncbi:MAG: hypothetical protein KDK00_09840, partial [Rhodobacteraceae bacterium]|nr:hypothetical protein [Paracoccaceae bacterium]